MPYDINETHDPKLESWVDSANDPETDFPIQNLPFCTFLLPPSEGMGCLSSVGVRIGDMVLDLQQLQKAKLLAGSGFGPDPQAFDMDANLLMLASPSDLRELRALISRLLTRGCDRSKKVHRCLIPASDVFFRANQIGDYTDFYASLHHATNVGSMFRPDNPILPNYKHIPIGYHGRASSIVPSGTPIRRPVGQQAPTQEGGAPGFGPCKLLDYELELGLIVGHGNELGEPIPMDQVEDHIFGMCILNDWSARDMQKWEYQPLGPFLAKSFASTLSPYIITMEALAPFRTPAFERATSDPQPLPYLDSKYNRTHGGVDITVEAYLTSADMRKRGMSPVQLSKGSFKDMYWTIGQMLAHHASNGCNMQPGDLLGSGTISGPKRENRGCMLELTWDGDPMGIPPIAAPGTQRTPIKLPTGEERKFLADGDEIILKAYCEREGFRRIGFGECRGIIEPPKE